MDVILDTESCHYRTTWEVFLKNNWCEEELPMDLVLIDCNELKDTAVKKKVQLYKGKTIFLVNASPKQAAQVAAIFYEYTPVSTIVDVIKNFSKHKIQKQETYPFSLTQKEASILKMLTNGWSNKEISQALNVSLALTKYYLQKIYKKMNVTNRTEAALAGMKNHL